MQEVDVRGSRAVSDEGAWGLVTASRTTTPTHKTTFNIRNCWGAAFRSLTTKIMALDNPPSPQVRPVMYMVVH